ncbi:MotA/TolQ/ExbB proton channel family protein [Roseibium denhamense]|uniref:Outer membrane transport energization protein ExbB n=1 Tax=Roseibium denhamense TaxID=76305 RepID=A0ABY1P597_9HYPH|nr:MotA/TolQ/ExbB proton channel family protein [Roseibium denhamense]MTI07150.1 MotA/TolQ/ExbB proton channel family protein [Roseibium denhamense]SMP26837.1 outer membrane transport energization protein ExbB [Roseibium denhamense]
MLPQLISQISAFLQLGGPVVTVIAGLSVIALALILVKVFEFVSCGVGTGTRAKDSVALWQSGRLTGLQTRFADPKSAACNAVATTCKLLAQRARKADIEERVSVQASKDLHHFSKGVRALEAIAQVAPLIGLFGTVLGMIEAFQALQNAGSNVDPSALAGGIWVALMTTAAGLAVAMPVSLVVTWLEARLEAERILIETLTSALLLPSAAESDHPEPAAFEPQLSYAR